MPDIAENIVSTMQRLSNIMPDSDVREVLRLVQAHGEYGLAMENQCSILEEKEVSIPPKVLDEIIELFREMDFAGDVLSYYKEHLQCDDIKTDKD